MQIPAEYMSPMHTNSRMLLQSSSPSKYAHQKHIEYVFLVFLEVGSIQGHEFNAKIFFLQSM